MIGSDPKVPLRKLGLLIVSSLFNAAICFGSFVFQLFATSPETQDITMRVGYYVLNVIVVAALVGIFGPWLLARREQNKTAAFLAILPTLLVCVAILAFLTLDSWLQRTFAS